MAYALDHERGSTFTGVYFQADDEETLRQWIDDWLHPWETTRRHVSDAKADRVHFATVEVNGEKRHMDEAEFNDYIVALKIGGRRVE